MATYNMYEYLDDVVADYTEVLLEIRPHETLSETPIKNQVTHTYDDNNIDVVSLTSKNWFMVTLQWDGIPYDEAGLIFDLYTDTAKADGSLNTFYWKHVDGYTYVARFSGELSRTFTHELMAGELRGIEQITLRVEGRKSIPTEET